MAWKWYGRPMHLAVCNKCRFHLSTLVGDGKWIVSTIGEYHPDPKGEPETIGMGRMYETYVFRARAIGYDDCDCPVACDGEIDSSGYNDHGLADAGHMEMCKKWDAIESHEGGE